MLGKAGKFRGLLGQCALALVRVPALLCEVEMHLLVDVLSLRVEFLEDLSKNVDCLLAAQACALRLEFLQEVLGGHGFPDKVSAHCILGQLHIAETEKGTNACFLCFFSTF